MFLSQSIIFNQPDDSKTFTINCIFLSVKEKINVCSVIVVLLTRGL